MNPSVVHAAAMPACTPAVPVAIVGAGACGLTAALMLRDAGIDCVLLERDARAQGSTALSSGFIPAAGTRAQAAAGIADSPDAFADDVPSPVGGEITLSGTPPGPSNVTRRPGPSEFTTVRSNWSRPTRSALAPSVVGPESRVRTSLTSTAATNR